jgi:phosphatidylinositol alpha-mannosyltransferase
VRIHSVVDPSPIDTPELPDTPALPPVTRPRGRYRRVALASTVLVAAGLVVLALANLNLSRVGHVLITATPGWLVLALALMAASLVLRSISWHQTLRAALPDASIRPMWVTRATMIGVMTSALFPGRIGEPSRVIVLTRRLQGPNRRLLPVVAGTVFSQTLINLLALAILLAVTFTSLPLLQGNVTGIVTALAVPLLVCALVIAGPRLLALARRSRSERIARAADAAGRSLHLARQGLVVFARPRYGATAVTSQLLAWALQWLACYAVLLALGLQSQAGLVAAAAILLAINLSAVLPATPSNVGVFQAACLVVLAAYGVGAGAALAYGILLQAVEVLTALALGVPALLGEGLRWSDVRSVPVTVPTEESAGEGAQ